MDIALPSLRASAFCKYLITNNWRIITRDRSRSSRTDSAPQTFEIKPHETFFVSRHLTLDLASCIQQPSAAASFGFGGPSPQQQQQQQCNRAQGKSCACRITHNLLPWPGTHTTF